MLCPDTKWTQDKLLYFNKNLSVLSEILDMQILKQIKNGYIILQKKTRYCYQLKYITENIR